MVEIGKLLSEGKGKRVYETDDPKTAVVYFKDEALAYHGLKRGRILGKGEVNNSVCAHLYQLLAEKGIENHFIEKLDARQSLVKRAEIIPITIKVRNRVAGSLGVRIGMETGTKLDSTIVEIVLRDEYLENPVINKTHILAMHLATAEEVDFMGSLIGQVRQVFRIFDELFSSFANLTYFSHIATNHQFVHGIDSDLKYVTLSYFSIFLLQILFGRRRQTTSQTFIRIH